jgi:DNA-binding LacI/PurR family transcriptional regulator
MAEIAVLAGVSKPTVSKVMNGQPGVAAATRERVERAIAERGYVRNGVARALSAGRVGSVHLVMSEIDSPYFVEILRGVEETLDRAGLSVVVTTTHDEERRHQRWMARVVEHGTDGVVLVLPDEHAAHLEELRHRGIPFAVVDDRGESLPGVPSVGATNFAGGFAATEHLLSLGHRRIAVIGGQPFRCATARLAGYHAALQEAGAPVDPALVMPGSFRVEAGYAAANTLLDLPEPPTAIFAGNDLQAMGVYRALYERGLRVPDDMSVVGFDDVPLVSLLTPALTTVRQPVREMGALATRMLLRIVAGKPLESTRVELATSLVARESCAPPCRSG